MNQAIAAAARRRRPGEDPRWYPVQLAFILLNLRGLVTPEHDDRETVDLLFFPTGGGKTEASLGLAAFVMVWRRLSHPGPRRLRSRRIDALHVAPADVRSAGARRCRRMRA
jgi:hypothetical protein